MTFVYVGLVGDNQKSRDHEDEWGCLATPIVRNGVGCEHISHIGTHEELRDRHGQSEPSGPGRLVHSWGLGVVDSVHE